MSSISQQMHTPTNGQHTTTLPPSISVASIPTSASNYSIESPLSRSASMVGDEEYEYATSPTSTFHNSTVIMDGENGDDELHLGEEQLGQIDLKDNKKKKQKKNSMTPPTGTTNRRLSLAYVKEITSGFFSSQIFAHILLLIAQLVFGGFCVLVPPALKVVNSMVFTCIRISLMSISMFPLGWLFDYSFMFPKNNNNNKTAETQQPQEHQLTTEQQDNNSTPTEENVNNQVAYMDNIDADIEQQQTNGKVSVKDLVLGKIPGKSDLILMSGCGVMLYISIAFYTAAVAFTSTTIAGILSPLAAVFTCLISVALKRESKSMLKFAGVLLAVAGSISMLVIISLADGKETKESSSEDSKTFLGMHLSVNSLLGVVFMIFNTLCWAIYLVLQKTILDRGIPPFTQSSWSMLAAAISSVIGAAYFFKDFHPTQIGSAAWIGLLYAAFVHGTVNYALNAFAARLVTPTVLSVYSCAGPIVSAVSLYLFMGETTTWLAAIGGTMITVGVLMVAWSKRREAMEKARLAQLAEQKGEVEERELIDHELSETTDRYDDKGNERGDNQTK